jgi:uncharacterized protein YdhG (YjbR/CyaY superfamily)
MAEEKKSQAATIDEYIAQFPEDVQQTLNQVREVIGQAAPQATERISYGMPCFYLNGNLVYFAAGKNYIGFYPTGEGVEAFKDQFEGYKWSKGAVQFPMNKPIPYDLITRITKFRVEQNLSKTASRKKPS